ncbi:MAG: hypothetical protein Q7U60_06615 [Candidatus Methanoperedens sp.]|nr:hypothetical protein [Candidatus Methanoperedens sp.]
MVSLNEVSEFLIKIKDVPLPNLLGGAGIAMIIVDIPFEITGKSTGLSGFGLVLIVFAFLAYQNQRSKSSKKHKSKSPPI